MPLTRLLLSARRGRATLPTRKPGGLAVWLFACWAAAQVFAAETGAPASPRLALAGSPHDFGRVRGGDVLRHEFLFTNTGTAKLELKLIKSTCGCFTVGDYTKAVEPGETGRVPVELTTATYSGAVSETMRFSTSDPDQPTAAFGVKALVWRPIEVTPQSAIFDVLPGSATPAQAVLHLTNRTSTPLTLEAPSGNTPAITADLATDEPGQSFTLTVRANPPPGSGNLYGRVTLKTSAAEMPVLEIPVFAMMRPPVTLMPPRLVLFGGTLPAAQDLVVSIQGATTNALKLDSPRASLANVQLQLAEVEAGKRYQLKATFPAGFVAVPGRQIEITVRSGDPRYPELRIPVLVLTNAPRAAATASP